MTSCAGLLVSVLCLVQRRAMLKIVRLHWHALIRAKFAWLSLPGQSALPHAVVAQNGVAYALIVTRCRTTFRVAQDMVHAHLSARAYATQIHAQRYLAPLHQRQCQYRRRLHPHQQHAANLMLVLLQATRTTVVRCLLGELGARARCLVSRGGRHCPQAVCARDRDAFFGALTCIQALRAHHRAKCDLAPWTSCRRSRVLQIASTHWDHGARARAHAGLASKRGCLR